MNAVLLSLERFLKLFSPSIMFTIVSRIKNNVNSFRFVLQFVGWAAMLTQGDIALDDISMSPECFGKKTT